MDHPNLSVAFGPTLLEREYECDALALALAAAADGAGSVVAVEGEAGIGKTSLLAHAQRCAAGEALPTRPTRRRALPRLMS